MDQEVIELLEELTTRNNDVEYAKRLHLLRTWAEESREDQTTKAAMEWLLDMVAYKLDPDDLSIFLELYFGDEPTKARRIAERHMMDVSTVYQRRNSVFSALMPIVFGVDGIRWRGGGDV